MEPQLNLIRKIAWSFNGTTGNDFEELFSEASLAYAEALHSFDENSNVKFTTFAYVCIHNRLKDFTRTMSQIHAHFTDLDTVKDFGYEVTPFWEVLETLSPKAQDLVTNILDAPTAFLADSQRQARGNLRRRLSDEGWSKRTIDNTFKEIKQVLI